VCGGVEGSDAEGNTSLDIIICQFSGMLLCGFYGPSNLSIMNFT